MCITLTDALVIGGGCLLAVLWGKYEIQAEERERELESKKERVTPVERITPTSRHWGWDY